MEDKLTTLVAMPDSKLVRRECKDAFCVPTKRRFDDRARVHACPLTWNLTDAVKEPKPLVGSIATTGGQSTQRESNQNNLKPIRTSLARSSQRTSGTMIQIDRWLNTVP